MTDGCWKGSALKVEVARLKCIHVVMKVDGQPVKFLIIPRPRVIRRPSRSSALTSPKVCRHLNMSEHVRWLLINSACDTALQAIFQFSVSHTCSQVYKGHKYYEEHSVTLQKSCITLKNAVHVSTCTIWPTCLISNKPMHRTVFPVVCTQCTVQIHQGAWSKSSLRSNDVGTVQWIYHIQRVV